MVTRGKTPCEDLMRSMEEMEDGLSSAGRALILFRLPGRDGHGFARGGIASSQSETAFCRGLQTGLHCMTD